MGCDIHLRVERKNAKGKWELVKAADAPEGTPLDGLDGFASYVERDEAAYLTFHDRNYDVFAMLANVRNGSGFAGCKTGDGFEPIAEPRGVPEDATAGYKRWVKQWNGDGHSHSWHTLAELIAYDWAGQVVKKVGVVSAGEYAAWKEAGGDKSPRSYSGDVGGGAVRKVSNEELDRRLADGSIRVSKRDQPHPFEGEYSAQSSDGLSYYTTVEWFSTYADRARRFLQFVEVLQRLGDPDAVRIVFFFDN